MKYPTGGCQEYEYDRDGHITVLRGEDGREFIRNEYDRKGRVIAQHYPDGTTCHMTYLDHERKTIFEYSDTGREEINYYNDKEEIVRREYGDGIFETYEYDDYGNKVAETDRNGNTTTFTYDAYGMLIRKCSPEGLETCYAYDENRQLIEEWDNTGAHKWYAYDKAGFLTEEKERLAEGTCATTTYTRDEYGRMLSVTDALGHTTEYYYEENIDKPTEVTTPEGYTYRYGYDKAGRRTKIVTDYGTKEISYSETGAVSMETDALGNRTRYQLDAVGNVLKTIKPNQYDEERDNGEGTYYEYDYLDRLILTKYPDGSRKEALFDMDGNLQWENLWAVQPGEVESRANRYIYDGRQYRIREEAPDGGITYFDRDKNGNLLKTIRPEEYALKGKAGEGIRYSYDGENRLTGIYNNEGKTFRRFVYDKKGRLIESFEGEASHGTRYEYDYAGRLTRKWVPVRVVSATPDSVTGENTGTVLYNLTCYDYDTAGNRILERRSGEEVTWGSMPLHFLDIRMHYDKQNRLVRVEDSLGAAVEYTYDCLNNRLTEKYRINDTTSRLICYKYDEAGRLTERMESVDLADVGETVKSYRKKEFLRTTYSYDKNGNITKITLPKSGEILREYDLMDRVVRETVRDATSGMDRTTLFAYDTAGRLISKKQDDGSIYSYTYDICGRLLSETNEEGGTTRYFHNRNGELVKTVSADNYDPAKDDGAGYSFTYDIFGRIKEVRDAYGHLCEANAYDTAGRIKSSHDSAGMFFTNEYDLGGRTTAVYDTEGATPVQTYTYDSIGNITGITDGERNHTDFELDAWGRITVLKAPDGSVETYTYDCAGNITSTTDGNGNTITYAYNSMQKLGSVTDQAGETDTFTYDGEGNLTGHVDRNGHKVTSTYGSFGLLLSETAEDGTFNHRKYDNRGRLVENASNHVVYRYDYTKTGKLRTKYINGKAALTYHYTKGGKVAGITDISGKTTEYTYDLNGNLTQVMEAGKVLVTYEYDEISRIRKIIFANGVTTEYTYDSERNMASLTTKGKDGSTLLSYSYRYDRNGNRVEKKDNAMNNHTTYAYDSMQRLCEVTYPETGKETYTYDAVGNRLEKKTESYVEGYIYDERNRLVQKQLWENETSVPADTTTYTYDAQGSLLREQGTELCKKYLYNDFHQCIQTEVIRGREEEAERILQENRYDGEGLRFSLIENGKRTDFITNGWENMAELDESGKVTKRIIRGMGIVASEDAEDNVIDATVAFTGTAYHYYHGNERMDVEYITDEAGKVVNGYTYDAFGTIVTSSEKLQNRYTYNGEAFDKTTEQYYLRKRFYNPKLSRFIQEDEYRGDDLNLYAFCANNPVMYVDPSGYKKRQVTYQDRYIHVDNNNIGYANYQTDNYLDIVIDREHIPTENGYVVVNDDIMSDIYDDFNKIKDPRIRGKEVEYDIAKAEINKKSYVRIGDGYDGKFPIIDLVNLNRAVSIKSLNIECKSYKDANGNKDVNKVVDQLMKYYNAIDSIDISVNENFKIKKELIVALNGDKAYKKLVRKAMKNRIKEQMAAGNKGSKKNKKAKCIIV